MKRNRLLLLLGILLPAPGSLFAQWSGTNPITTLSNVGIGTNSPAAGYKLHVDGDVRFTESAYNSNYITFALPNGENGLTLAQGAGQRADLRFNGSVVKLVAHATSGPPSPENGVAVSTNGFTGIGNASPLTRLQVNQKQRVDFGAFVNGNNTKAALWVRRDFKGTNSAPGLSSYAYGGGGFLFNSVATYSIVGDNDFNEITENVRSGGGFFAGSNLGGAGIVSGFRKGVPSQNLATGLVGYAGLRYSPQTDVSEMDIAVGVEGYAEQGVNTRGGLFMASSSLEAVGVFGDAWITSEAPNSRAYGVYGVGRSGQVQNWGTSGSGEGGVYAYGAAGWAYNGQYNYGVYGTVNTTNPSDYAGYFSGNVFTTGLYMGSDERLKENVRSIENSLDIINRLQPKTYNFRQSDDFKGLNLERGVQYGLIAQELEQVLPALVHETRNPEVSDPQGKVRSKAFDFKTVNYVALIPILIQGIKEQQEQITDLKEQLARLKTGAASGPAVKDGPQSGASSMLYQNNPNPATGATSIRYELAAGAGSAFIVVYDLNGTQLKKFPLELSAAKGSVVIEKGSLQPGMYYYSLLVEGREIKTLKMIIQ